MKKYVLIEHHSGLVWDIVNADTPEQACMISAKRYGGEAFDHQPVDDITCNQTGFVVHLAPDDFKIINRDSIEAIPKMPLIGKFRRILNSWSYK